LSFSSFQPAFCIDILARSALLVFLDSRAFSECIPLVLLARRRVTAREAEKKSSFRRPISIGLQRFYVEPLYGPGLPL